MRGHCLSIVFSLLCAFSFEGAGAATRISEIPGYQAMIDAEFAAGPTLAFADAAEAAGDPDAAIAALEQLLVREPDNRDAHARIARLYEAVGNDALAEVHRDRAGLPPKTQIWGRAVIGVAHQTNPTAVPGDASVPIFSAAQNTFVQIAAGQAREDQSGIVRLNVNLAHALGEDALLAAEIALATETYAATEQLNNLTVRGRIGPWLSTPGLGEGASVRPFLTLGSGMLDSSPYFGQIGAGVVLNLPLDEDMTFSALADVRYTDFSGAISPSFDADTLDNLALRAGGRLSGSTGDFGYGIYAYGSYAAASADHESYAAVRAGANASVPVPSGERFLGIPVLFRLGASVDWFGYGDPNPAIDPNTTRRDVWIGGNGALVLGLTDKLDLSLGASYVRRFSNLQVFDSQNVRVFAEMGVGF